VLSIEDQANLKVWSWDVWQSDSTGESLIFLWIVILEGNLQFNSLLEFSLFGFLLHFSDAFQDELVRDL